MILVNSASSKVIQVNFHSPLVKSLFSSAPNCKMCVAVKLVEVESLESSGTCESNSFDFTEKVELQDYQ